MGLTEFLLAVAVIGGIIAVLYPTLRGAAADAERDRVAGDGGTDGGVWTELEERRQAILRSLDEIEADRETGNLSEEDYRELRRRYEAEATEILREQAALGEPVPARGRRGAPKPSESGARSRVPSAIGWGIAVIGFAALAGLVLSSALRPRGEGDTITGNLPGAETSGGTSGGALMPVDEGRLTELEQQIAEDSSDVPALAELGHLYLSTQQFDRVARVSMKALSLEPRHPESLTHLGMVLVAANHTAEAQRAFDEALQVDPDFPEALLYKGIVSFQNREFQSAVEAWEHYLEVAPEEANTERVRAMLEGARQAVGSSDD